MKKRQLVSLSVWKCSCPLCRKRPLRERVMLTRKTLRDVLYDRDALSRPTNKPSVVRLGAPWWRRTWTGWTPAFALLLGIASVALMVLGVALILWSQQP